MLIMGKNSLLLQLIALHDVEIDNDYYSYLSGYSHSKNFSAFSSSSKKISIKPALNNLLYNILYMLNFIFIRFICC